MYRMYILPPHSLIFLVNLDVNFVVVVDGDVESILIVVCQTLIAVNQKRMFVFVV